MRHCRQLCSCLELVTSQCSKRTSETTSAHSRSSHYLLSVRQRRLPPATLTHFLSVLHRELPVYPSASATLSRLQFYCAYGRSSVIDQLSLAVLLALGLVHDLRIISSLLSSQLWIEHLAQEARQNNGWVYEGAEIQPERQ